jgi:putative redox protein
LKKAARHNWTEIQKTGKEVETMGAITLRWVEDKMMVVSDTNGHSIVVGRSPDPQFQWVGVKPSDLLLMAVASCSAYDVVEILTKQREPLRDLKIICNGDQLSDPPYTFTCIHLHYRVFGAVNPEKLERAIHLSEDKYCSVVSTLRPGVPITSDFEIIP